jgi:hypothetical protein
MKNNKLELSDIKKSFNLPLSEAAIKLNVSEEELLRICEENHIKFWPYKKLQILNQKLKEINNNERRKTIKVIKPTVIEKIPEKNNLFKNVITTIFKKKSPSPPKILQKETVSLHPSFEKSFEKNNIKSKNDIKLPSFQQTFGYLNDDKKKEFNQMNENNNGNSFEFTKQKEIKYPTIAKKNVFDGLNC